MGGGGLCLLSRIVLSLGRGEQGDQGPTYTVAPLAWPCRGAVTGEWWGGLGQGGQTPCWRRGGQGEPPFPGGEITARTLRCTTPPHGALGREGMISDKVISRSRISNWIINSSRKEPIRFSLPATSPCCPGSHRAVPGAAHCTQSLLGKWSVMKNIYATFGCKISTVVILCVFLFKLIFFVAVIYCIFCIYFALTTAVTCSIPIFALGPMLVGPWSWRHFLRAQTLVSNKHQWFASIVE